MRRTIQPQDRSQRSTTLVVVRKAREREVRLWVLWLRLLPSSAFCSFCPLVFSMLIVFRVQCCHEGHHLLFNWFFHLVFVFISHERRCHRRWRRWRSRRPWCHRGPYLLLPPPSTQRIWPRTSDARYLSLLRPYHDSLRDGRGSIYRLRPH